MHMCGGLTINVRACVDVCRYKLDACARMCVLRFYTCIYVSVHVHAFIHVCMCVCKCMCAFMRACVCLHMCVCDWLGACVWVYMYVRTMWSMDAFVCVHVCAHAHVHIHVRTLKLRQLKYTLVLYRCWCMITRVHQGCIQAWRCI